ncbi:protein YgfX [Thalassotalea piscium]|uniref:Uncharacterized protein n=1 Tax=Thalassotalea piscium TaxID=1230533 RepID=A0A7X0NFY6_9GAMM|nr:protein YgfX [Thalassotalea piscium]MBB6542704.1 hypothetical protein [Thalassotalea piscium]
MVNVLLVLALLNGFYSLFDATSALVIAVIIGTSLACLWVFKYHMKHQTLCQYQLDEQGQWRWVNKVGELESYQITENSRVAFYGCYLILQPCKSNNLNMPDAKEAAFNSSVKQQFIFKDSLNTQDYARLCRIIRHLNRQ